MGFPGGASSKEPTCQCRRHKKLRFDPWVGKIPWRREWLPLQYSCLENPMDRGAWWVHRVTKSWTHCSDSMYACMQGLKISRLQTTTDLIQRSLRIYDITQIPLATSSHFNGKNSNAAGTLSLTSGRFQGTLPGFLETSLLLFLLPCCTQWPISLHP